MTNHVVIRRHDGEVVHLIDVELVRATGWVKQDEPTADPPHTFGFHPYPSGPPNCTGCGKPIAAAESGVAVGPSQFHIGCYRPAEPSGDRLTYVEGRLVRAEAELLRFGQAILGTAYMKQFPEPYIPGEPLHPNRPAEGL